eukprot:jgi/Undpi1/377/HiC_scaffold_1.g00373.m1
MEGHHLYSEAAETGVAPAELAAVAEELAKTSSKIESVELALSGHGVYLGITDKDKLLGQLEVLQTKEAQLQKKELFIMGAVGVMATPLQHPPPSSAAAPPAPAPSAPAAPAAAAAATAAAVPPQPAHLPAVTTPTSILPSVTSVAAAASAAMVSSPANAGGVVGGGGGGGGVHHGPRIAPAFTASHQLLSQGGAPMGSQPPPMGSQGGPMGTPGVVVGIVQQPHAANSGMGGVPQPVGGGSVMGMNAGHMGALGGVDGGGGRGMLGHGMGVAGQHAGGGVGVAVMGGVSLAPVKRRVSREGDAEPDNKRRSRISAQCQHVGCTTARTFGREGDKHASFCAIHKEEGMVNIKGRRCNAPGCQHRPGFAMPSDRRGKFCATHREPGMIDVVSRKCQVEGGECDRQPVYGWPGDRATRCGTHKLERTLTNLVTGAAVVEKMYDVRGKRCQAKNCIRQPGFGDPPTFASCAILLSYPLFCRGAHCVAILGAASPATQFAGYMPLQAQAETALAASVAIEATQVAAAAAAASAVHELPGASPPPVPVAEHPTEHSERGQGVAENQGVAAAGVSHAHGGLSESLADGTGRVGDPTAPIGGSSSAGLAAVQGGV